MNDTRISRARGVVSSLNLTNIKKKSVVKAVQFDGREIQDFKVRKSHIKPTRVQEIIRELEALFKDKGTLIKEEDFPWEEIGKLAKKAKTPEELSHLLLIVQMRHVAARNRAGYVPFQYWAPFQDIFLVQLLTLFSH